MRAWTACGTQSNQLVRTQANFLFNCAVQFNNSEKRNRRSWASCIGPTARIAADLESRVALANLFPASLRRLLFSFVAGQEESSGAG